MAKGNSTRNKVKCKQWDWCPWESASIWRWVQEELWFILHGDELMQTGGENTQMQIHGALLIFYFVSLSPSSLRLLHANRSKHALLNEVSIPKLHRKQREQFFLKAKLRRCILCRSLLTFHDVKKSKTHSWNLLFMAGTAPIFVFLSFFGYVQMQEKSPNARSDFLPFIVYVVIHKALLQLRERWIDRLRATFYNLP